MAPSSGSMANRAGRALRWSMRICSARPRRCSATGTCNRRCCAGRSRREPLRCLPRRKGASRRAGRARRGARAVSSACCLWRRAGRGPTGSAAILLPPVEEFATEQLMETRVRPAWLIWAALALTLGSGRLLPARLARRRARAAAPVDPARPGRQPAGDASPAAASPTRMSSRLALDPAAGVALLALGMVGDAARARAGARCWPQ